VIEDVQVEVGITDATVTWTTDEPADSRVVYGLTEAYELGEVFDGALVTAHSLELSGLQPETLYHYQVSSTDESGNTSAAPGGTFVTEPEAGDDQPPVIENVQVEAGTNGATITWTTDEPADSRVVYGLTEAYELGEVFDGALVTAHSLELSGLQPETLYHYQVSSTDESGNTSAAPGGTFVTDPEA
jgi:chitodextrinase